MTPLTTDIRSANSQSSKLLVVCACVLTVVAAIPRFWELGALGFYGDEETTSLPSRSLAEGNGARMPSGMPYKRALPQTWVNSLSAHVFGVDQEFAYRAPSALIGTLTVVAALLLLYPYTGLGAAVAVAVCLALSEWHIILSREARMYAPFLFFYLSCGLVTWRWADTGRRRYLVLSALTFAGAMSMHSLSLFCALLPLLPLAFPEAVKVKHRYLLLLSASMAFFARYYSTTVSGPPFSSWRNAEGRVSALLRDTSASSANELGALFSLSLLEVAVYLLGLVLAIWILRSSQLWSRTQREHRLRDIALTGLFASTCLAAVGAHLYLGAALAAISLIVFPGPKLPLIKRARVPAAAVGAIASIHAVLIVSNEGISEGLRRLFGFPYPNILTIAEAMPLLAVVFGCAILYLAVTNASAASRFFRISVLASLAPLLLLGMVHGDGHLRYLVEAYPFMLISCVLLAAYASQSVLDRLSSRRARIAVAAVGAVVLLIVLPSHGIAAAYRSATIGYGDSTRSMHLDFYPDHKNPGLFVRSRLRDTDTVIAEDALQQQWYTGRVDYWLRSPTLESRFHYRELSSGLQKDVYVSSTILAFDDIAQLLATAAGRVFLITSGETISSQRYYMDADQIAWLENVKRKHAPAFTGEDGQTQVFCLNCKPAD